jgi:vacuolar iron transporter family protein
VRGAAVGPWHLAERGLAEVDAAHVAASESIVVGVEELPAAFDLVERETQDLFGACARLLGEQGGERGRTLAGHDVAEQRGEIAAALHQIAAQALALFGWQTKGHLDPANVDCGMARRHREKHRSTRSGWLRAAVLGSNDAIVSTASLMMGVAASHASKDATFITGMAGLVAGAMSMAAGEFVSVSSQHDAESADIAMEKHELETSPEAELQELAGIYRSRGLSKDLAFEVAQQLSAHDQLAAHLRDELGIEEETRARPLQAAWISAVSFALFALLPILALLVAPAAYRMHMIASVTLVSLATLGALGGKLAGAPMLRASLRVTIGGALAMAVTAGIGHLLGVTL